MSSAMAHEIICFIEVLPLKNMKTMKREGIEIGTILSKIELKWEVTSTFGSPLLVPHYI
jgi:hypothetical protein